MAVSYTHLDVYKRQVVYCLDGLSVDAAKQLAGHYGVQAISEFWEAVEDGAYELSLIHI